VQEEPICDDCLIAFWENCVVGPEPDSPSKTLGLLGIPAKEAPWSPESIVRARADRDTPTQKILARSDGALASSRKASS
jgi:hypothetical protein